VFPSMQDIRMQCKSGQDTAGCGILVDIPNIRAHMPNIRGNVTIPECPKRCRSKSEAGSQCGARVERVSEAVYQCRIFGPIHPMEHTKPVRETRAYNRDKNQ